MKAEIFTLLGLLLSLFSHSQCRVSHLSGSQNIGLTSVNVTHVGDVVIDTTIYCDGKLGPYVVGVHYNPLPFSCQLGAYSFSFVPPVNEVFLSFGSINGSNLDSEIIKIYVNGLHYSIPTVGTKLNCQQLAILTPDGDIASPNWNVSGWDSTRIIGNIDSIMILDSVVKGCGNGALFSLSLCDWPVSTNDYLKNERRIKVYPNPINSELNIEYDCSSEGELVLYNSFGQQVYNYYLPKGKKTMSKNLSELNNGLYLYRCRFKGYSDTFGKITVNK